MKECDEIREVLLRTSGYWFDRDQILAALKRAEEGMEETEEGMEEMQERLSSAQRKNEYWAVYERKVEEALGLKHNEGSSLGAIQRLNADNALLIKANLELAAKFTESEKNGARYLSERDFYRDEMLKLQKEPHVDHATWVALVKENAELRESLASPRSPSYVAMQTELRAAIHDLEGTNAALRADRELLQKRLRSTIKNLHGHTLKISTLEGQIDNFKTREMVGQMWESELREVLGIAGPHTRGVKIIDTVKSILAAKSWQHYEPEIRKMERERIFRKLTALGDLASSGFLSLWAHDKNYQIKYTERQMSDFLKEE